MFKNVQLVLLPQHMWAENKEGREACRGRKNEVFSVFFFSFLSFFLVYAKESPYCNKCSSWPLTHLEKWKENNLSEINTCREKKKRIFWIPAVNKISSLLVRCLAQQKKYEIQKRTPTCRGKKSQETATRRKRKKGGEVKQWSDFKASFYPICLEF